MKYLKVLISGIIAGLAIGFGGLSFILAKATLANAGGLVGAFLFPFGLYIICLLKAHLYTGKVGFFLNDKDNIITNTINLPVMILGNFIGVTIMGLLSNLFLNTNAPVMSVVTSITSAKDEANALITLLKAMLCGVLVYLAVYLYNKASDGISKFLAILIPIFIFAFCGFDHCIANAYYYAFSASFNIYSLLNIIMAIIGNSLGSLIINYALKFMEK